MSGPCTFCIDAGSDFDYCRVCGRGEPQEQPQVEPMSGLRLAVRLAKGGPLSTDGPAEREALRLAVAMSRKGQADA